MTILNFGDTSRSSSIVWVCNDYISKNSDIFIAIIGGIFNLLGVYDASLWGLA